MYMQGDFFSSFHREPDYTSGEKKTIFVMITVDFRPKNYNK